MTKIQDQIQKPSHRAEVVVNRTRPEDIQQNDLIRECSYNQRFSETLLSQIRSTNQRTTNTEMRIH